jgi:hypothetical protein
VRPHEIVGMFVRCHRSYRHNLTTAPAVDHLMIRSAVLIEHHRQAQTRRPRGMSLGFLVQSPPRERTPAAPEDLPSAARHTSADRVIHG